MILIEISSLSIIFVLILIISNLNDMVKSEFVYWLIRQPEFQELEDKADYSHSNAGGKLLKKLYYKRFSKSEVIIKIKVQKGLFFVYKYHYDIDAHIYNLEKITEINA